MINGLYGIPGGVDFPKALIAGLDAAYASHPPEALARMTLVVNTARMRRRLHSVYHSGKARLFPRILTVEELADHAALPRARSPLTRRLELAHLIAQAAEKRPGFAEYAQRFALADSLAELLDDLEGENVDPEILANLEGPDLSDHWAETQAFIAIASDYQRALGGASGSAGRLRRAVDALATTLPADQPVVLAGSTGSHGAVLDLMAKLLSRDNAAVVLPGFDPHLDAQAWHDIAAAPNWEDHPQARFVGLARHLDWKAAELAAQVKPWPATPTPEIEARARLWSLALCPAPVSDQWLAKGPALGDPAPATKAITLLEAPGPREEAMAIALGIRASMEEGKTVALITPDRVLGRRVTAQLARWDILPDDSAGIPLGLTALGRLARQVAELAKAPPNLSQVLALLKHPLCATGPSRGAHQTATRRFELWLRKKEHGLPGTEALTKWAAETGLESWTSWLRQTVLPLLTAPPDLAGWVGAHRARLDAIISGFAQDGEVQRVWSGEEGRAVNAVLVDLTEASQAAPEAASMPNPMDYLAFFQQALHGQELRTKRPSRSDIVIWGTQEARASGADLAILAGLTEGVWPSLPEADPWLNRSLRKAIGLPAPERRVGLQAHDFQQAALAPEIWLCRPLRDDEADTIAARWLMRLTGLLDGLGTTGGPDALEAMRARGQQWLARAEQLEQPQHSPAAKRPCPAPPVAFRPSQLSATDLQRLRRDPYAIYAKRVLRLSPLSPLSPAPDAAARGILLHRIFECALADSLPPDAKGIITHLLRVGERVIAEESAWPTAQLVWQARLKRLAPSFAAAELDRPAPQARHLEAFGKLVGPHDVTLTAKADRIDIDKLGRAHLFDYKTGKPPGDSERRCFDPQMAVMGWMLAEGAFQPPGRKELADMAYLHLGHELAEKPVPLSEAEDMGIKLAEMLGRMKMAETGFPARIMPRKTSDLGDFDHLARYGEWEMTDDPEFQVLT